MYNELLEVFVKVADLGSFTKASEVLYISSTAIMKQMNILEEHIGLPLLIRTPRGVQLTEAGKSIYKDAKFLMQYSKDSIDRAYLAERKSRQTIRIGSSVLYPCKYFIDLWNQVNNEYSGFRLKVVPFEDSNTGMAFRDVGKKYDLIAGVYDSFLQNNPCEFLELGKYHYCLSMSKRHPLSRRKSISLKDLYGENLMIVKRGISASNDQLRNEIETKHPQIQLVDTPNYYDVEVFNACEENGYILLTLDGWKDIHPSLVTIPFKVLYTVPYGIIYSKNPKPELEKFIEIVAQIKQNR